ncbi:hypothetical protein BR93DRAFT_940181 [Coniochaeta sp. PMI_546]|nr:hypothetical protein BR93DRAFT_940181 [Coniochaeta sp. PMI_546]
MSARIFTSSSRALRLAPKATSQRLFTRTITQTRALGLKETASADPNPEAFEKHKQDSLAKQKQGKGHWKPELASNSEESIWADRMSPDEASEEAMKRLQERTKEAAETNAKAGTSMSDGLGNSK